jgi:hypothetical protein
MNEKQRKLLKKATKRYQDRPIDFFKKLCRSNVNHEDNVIVDSNKINESFSTSIDKLAYINALLQKFGE